jgi:hypothetical protein
LHLGRSAVWQNWNIISVLVPTDPNESNSLTRHFHVALAGGGDGRGWGGRLKETDDKFNDYHAEGMKSVATPVPGLSILITFSQMP